MLEKQATRAVRRPRLGNFFKVPVEVSEHLSTLI